MKLLQSRSLCQIKITNLEDMFLLSLKKKKSLHYKEPESCKKSPYLMSKYSVFLKDITYIARTIIEKIYTYTHIFTSSETMPNLEGGVELQERYL